MLVRNSTACALFLVLGSCDCGEKAPAPDPNNGEVDAFRYPPFQPFRAENRFRRAFWKKHNGLIFAYPLMAPIDLGYVLQFEDGKKLVTEASKNQAERRGRFVYQWPARFPDDLISGHATDVNLIEYSKIEPIVAAKLPLGASAGVTMTSEKFGGFVANKQVLKSPNDKPKFRELLKKQLLARQERQDGLAVVTEVVWADSCLFVAATKKGGHANIYSPKAGLLGWDKLGLGAKAGLSWQTAGIDLRTCSVDDPGPFPVAFRVEWVKWKGRDKAGVDLLSDSGGAVEFAEFTESDLLRLAPEDDDAE